MALINYLLTCPQTYLHFSKKRPFFSFFVQFVPKLHVLGTSFCRKSEGSGSCSFCAALKGETTWRKQAWDLIFLSSFVFAPLEYPHQQPSCGYQMSQLCFSAKPAVKGVLLPYIFSHHLSKSLQCCIIDDSKKEIFFSIPVTSGQVCTQTSIFGASSNLFCSYWREGGMCCLPHE